MRREVPSPFHKLIANPAQLAAGAASLAFTAASAAVGVIVGHMLGAQYGPTLAVVFATAALAGEILKPFAFLALWRSARRLRIASAAVCAVVALSCLAYSLAADLYLSSRLRGDMAAQRDHAARLLDDARADRQRLTASLAELRSDSSVRAEIDRLLVTPGANGCAVVDGPVSREVCKQVEQLRADRAATESRRRTIEAELMAVNAAIRAADGHVSADPLASAISAYARALGVADWKPADVAPWLALLLPALLEIGSSLGLVVTASLGCPNPAHGSLPSGAPSPAASGFPVSRALASVELEMPATEAPGGTGDDPDAGSGSALGTAVLDHVRSRGGVVRLGQRELAEALAASKSEIHRVLHQLQREGRVLLSADHRGTRIELASGQPM
jgi:hypothetical protein